MAVALGEAIIELGEIHLAEYHFVIVLEGDLEIIDSRRKGKLTLMVIIEIVFEIGLLPNNSRCHQPFNYFRNCGSLQPGIY